MILSFVWDPIIGFPVDKPIIRFYSLMFVLAFVCAYYIMYIIFKKEKKNTDVLEPLLIYSLLSMIIGIRLGEVFLYNWDYFKDHLLEAVIPIRETSEGWKFVGFSGLASHGGVVGFLTGFYLFHRKYMKDTSYLWLLDRVCLTIALGGAFVRLGNFINSEIVGKTVDQSFIFATQFPQMNEDYGNPLDYRHPTQLYEAACYLIFFIFLAFIYFKTEWRKKEGAIVGLFFFGLWSIRAAIEYFFKEAQPDEAAGIIHIEGLNNGFIYSVPLALGGLLLMIWALSRKPKEENTTA